MHVLLVISDHMIVSKGKQRVSRSQRCGGFAFPPWVGRLSRVCPVGRVSTRRQMSAPREGVQS
jgi:hypothetical protein